MLKKSKISNQLLKNPKFSIIFSFFVLLSHISFVQSYNAIVPYEIIPSTLDDVSAAANFQFIYDSPLISTPSTYVTACSGVNILGGPNIFGPGYILGFYFYLPPDTLPHYAYEVEITVYYFGTTSWGGGYLQNVHDETHTLDYTPGSTTYDASCSGYYEQNINIGYGNQYTQGTRWEFIQVGAGSNNFWGLKSLIIFLYTCDQGICQDCRDTVPHGLTNSYCVQCDPLATLLGSAPSSYCQCNSGYYDAGSSCSLCDGSCLTCNAGTNADCVTCVGGKYISSGYCLDCDGSCLTCSGGGTINDCLTCQPGHLLTTVSAPNGICCDTSCLTCNGITSNDCTSCPLHYELITVVAPAGYCQVICDVTCATCSGWMSTECVTCPDGRYLSGGQCLTCDPTCPTCDGGTNGNCLTCYPGFALRLIIAPSGACDIPCDVSCYECTGGQNFQCTSCVPGKYLAATGQCLDCDYTCKTCSEGTINDCLTCKTYWIFHQIVLPNGYCTPICHSSCLTCDDVFVSNCTSCPTHYALMLLQQSSGYCQVICHATCATCSGYTSSECLSCFPGYYLDSGRCFPICDDTCATCKGILPNDCLSCYPYAHVNNNGYCVCDKGYYCNGTNCADKCFKCQMMCDSCDYKKCFVCSDPNMFIVGAECWYDCPKPYNKNSIDKTCYLCDSTCKTCFGPNDNNCLSCYDSFILDENKCLSECPYNKYLDENTQTCLTPTIINTVYRTVYQNNIYQIEFSQNLDNFFQKLDDFISFSFSSISNDDVIWIFSNVSNQTNKYHFIFYYLIDKIPDNSTVQFKINLENRTNLLILNPIFLEFLDNHCLNSQFFDPSILIEIKIKIIYIFLFFYRKFRKMSKKIRTPIAFSLYIPV